MSCVHPVINLVNKNECMWYVCDCLCGGMCGVFICVAVRCVCTCVCVVYVCEYKYVVCVHVYV
jgi:hypothetical protein